jgi:16S rRNA (adenine1518-N6/adenine1519-N6)-dimethyltransferase
MPHPKEILKWHRIEPKKSLGQNFLFDENMLGRIVAAAELTADDNVLEIGAGLGHLTMMLAETAVRVIAVEIDNRLLPILHNQFEHLDHVTIIHGDILQQEPALMFTQPYKVVANVPYYITGGILRHLLSAPIKPTRMVLTVQKEVAERLTAVPPQMSLLAVSVQLYGDVQFIDTLKAGSFWPRPDVDSAVIRIDLHDEPSLPLPEENAFFRVVKAGFSQKRKQLQKNMRQLGLSREEITAVMQQAHIEEKRRAETLRVTEWIALYDQIKAITERP